MRPLRDAVRARSRARAAVAPWVARRPETPEDPDPPPRDRARVPTCDERGERRARGADDVTRDRHVRK